MDKGKWISGMLRSWAWKLPPYFSDPSHHIIYVDIIVSLCSPECLRTYLLLPLLADFARDALATVDRYQRKYSHLLSRPGQLRSISPRPLFSSLITKSFGFIQRAG